MTLMLALGVLALTGLLAAAAWARQAVRPPPWMTSRAALAVTAWAGLTVLAAIIGLLSGDVAHPVVTALLAGSTLSGVIGVWGTAGRTVRGPTFAYAAAESALVACSVMSVCWIVSGAPSRPRGSALVVLALTTVDVAVATLVLRSPIATSRPAAGRRHRLLGVAVASGVALADGVLTLHLLGVGVPGAVSPALRAVSCLLCAAVPWVSSPVVPQAAGTSSASPHPPSALVRGLPYLLVAAAVGLQFAVALRRPVGPVSLGLVSAVVTGLAVVQGLERRENGRLLRDLEASRTRLKALVDNAGDVILGLDATGSVTSANAAAVPLLHRTPDAMIGLEAAELAVLEDRSRLRAVVLPVVRGGRSFDRVEFRLAPPATGTAELRLQSVAGGAVANLSDVTESVQLRQRLERLVRFDEMTGLPNRTHLLGELDAWLRTGQRVSVLYTDLDGFKAVNDRFGHHCGDGVLAEAARRIQLAVQGLPGERLLVARMGGDEFVVALMGTGPEEVTTAIERVVASMRPTFGVVDRAVRVGLSIGVASTDDRVSAGLRGAADLLHRADVAMFAAKQAGRSRVMHWDAAMEARALRRVDIAIGLRRALDRHRLGLAYQPLVRLSDGAVIGVEALIRVATDDQGPGALAGLPDLVTPAELVAVAEDTGEIIELGEWVLGEATRQAARWRADGHDIFVTVNVSVQQMAADGFIESVTKAIEESGLPAGSLVVEITEGQLLSEQDPAWRAVEQLRELGVVLVIDDFGSGYSSLAYLRRLPVRGVKLDRALLDELSTDPRARTLARAVIAAARALGLLVVAEGLETLEEARVVRDLGAYAGQGFALFGALPADGVARALAGPPVNLGVPRGGGTRPDGDGRVVAGGAGSPLGPAPAPATPLTIDLTVQATSSLRGRE